MRGQVFLMILAGCARRNLVRGFVTPTQTTTTWTRSGDVATTRSAAFTTITKVRHPRKNLACPLRATLPNSIEAETKEFEEYQPPLLPNGSNTPLDEKSYLTLPRHSHEGVNDILLNTEKVIRQLHVHSKQIQQKTIEAAKETGRSLEKVYANNYVDLGKVDTVGFDFDYTLVTYSEELLELIYDMALNRLVTSRQYPEEMLDSGLSFDPFFSIRGLAVDIKTGWVCHLSSTHKVAVAFEGRQRVPTSRIYDEYRGKRGMPPAERKRRLRPLNDL